MMKIYKFDPVIYPIPLLITKDIDSTVLNGRFYVVNTDNELEEDTNEFTPKTNTVARTIMVVNKKTMLRYILILIFRQRDARVGIISHEALHYTNMVAEMLGFLPQDSMEDEPSCYLLQWVTDCIWSFLKGRPESMKGEKYKL